MNMYGYEIVRESDLAHHGIKGQKWGIRRFQNKDGSFNSAGKQRYFGSGGGENYKPVGSGGGSRSAKGSAHRALAKVYDINERFYSKHGNKTMASANKAAKAQQLKKAEEADKKKAEKPGMSDKTKKNLKTAAKVGAAVVGTALVAYGGYKVYQHGVNVKNDRAAAAKAEYIRKQTEIGKRLYNETVKKMMADSRIEKGSYGTRLADGNWLYTEWEKKK